MQRWTTTTNGRAKIRVTRRTIRICWVQTRTSSTTRKIVWEEGSPRYSNPKHARNGRNQESSRTTNRRGFSAKSKGKSRGNSATHFTMGTYAKKDEFFDRFRWIPRQRKIDSRSQSTKKRFQVLVPCWAATNACHLTHGMPSSSQISEFDVNRHTENPDQKEVEVRVESFGETHCMKPQKPKTKIIMENPKKYKKIYCMHCLMATGIEGEFGWWKYFNRALPKPRERKSRHFQVISWTSKGIASKSGIGFGWAQCIFTLSNDRNCDVFLKTQITIASCRKRACAVVSRVGTFLWLDYCRSSCSQ